MDGKGKFGRAALAISAVTSAILVVTVILALFLLINRIGTARINYGIGMTILFCWLFELVAIVVAIIGLFETSGKRHAWIAIAVSLVCFIGTFVPTIMGLH